MRLNVNQIRWCHERCTLMQVVAFTKFTRDYTVPMCLNIAGLLSEQSLVNKYV